jgi:hypothetical protein
MREGQGVYTIRRMTPADKPALLALDARIFGGMDYLGAVFDGWVADREGEFAAVLLGGRVVGCGKLTFLTPADVWLEGLRKDPDLVEKGVAAAVTSHFLEELAGRPGLHSIRFSTSTKNLASIAAHERMGFRRCLTLSRREWSGTRAELEAVPDGPAAPGRLVVRRIAEAAEACLFLEAGGYLEATRGLLLDGWRGLPYSRELVVARYVEPGHCWGAFDSGRLAGVMIAVQAANRAHLYLKTVVLDARETSATHLLLDRLFAIAREKAMDYNEVELVAPPLARILEPCAQRGLQSGEQEGDVLVCEYPVVVGTPGLEHTTTLAVTGG